MRLALTVGLAIGLAAANGNAQSIAPSRTFGAQPPTTPMIAPGTQMPTPRAKPQGVPTEGAGVATPTGPGLTPLKPLQPFVSKQAMPTIAHKQRDPQAVAEGMGTVLKDRQMYKTGYGLSWYDAPPPDANENVITPDSTTRKPTNINK